MLLANSSQPPVFGDDAFTGHRILSEFRPAAHGDSPAVLSGGEFPLATDRPDAGQAEGSCEEVFPLGPMGGSNSPPVSLLSLPQVRPEASAPVRRKNV